MRNLHPAVRRGLVELAVVLVPAGLVLLGAPSFSWSVTAALVACLLLPLRHIWPPLALLGAVWGLAGGLGWLPAQVALYALGRWSGRMWVTLPWLALPVVSAVVPVLLTQVLSWQTIVLMVVVVILYTASPAALGLLVSTRARLTESLRQLEVAREEALVASQDAARAQERARIGREIHDAVGHHATLIAVGAAAIAASTGEDETRRGAEQLRILAKRALAEMRAALGLLDGTEHPAGFTEIAALVAGSRAAGVDVALLDDGEPRDIAPGVGRAVYRVVQESLTNAARHAPGTAVRVELRWRPTELQVQIRNAAPARTHRRRRDVQGGGAGLTGLTERVTAMGGLLSAAPTSDGGFLVAATFPLGADPAPGMGGERSLAERR
ncbi:sensor histidine kinase [Pseudonocardia nigra]|uniref:sensor histidine kinase n=1 Tax=Pseudonocardia nigra TaxID=1921578 RepID=UPI001C5F7F36|nr:histidine kinase [Pseudonocardia nigra]